MGSIGPIMICINVFVKLFVVIPTLIFSSEGFLMYYRSFNRTQMYVPWSVQFAFEYQNMINNF